MTVTGIIYAGTTLCETGQGITAIQFTLPQANGQCYPIEFPKGDVVGYAAYQEESGEFPGKFKFASGSDKNACDNAEFDQYSGSPICQEYNDPSSTTETSYQLTADGFGEEKSSSDSDLNGGEIAGIVIGSVVGVILIYYLYKKNYF